MTVNSNAVNISTVGTASQLQFFWAINGTATWHPETVAAPAAWHSRGINHPAGKQPMPDLRCLPAVS
jgi:hypothetical protein